MVLVMQDAAREAVVLPLNPTGSEGRAGGARGRTSRRRRNDDDEDVDNQLQPGEVAATVAALTGGRRASQLGSMR